MLSHHPSEATQTPPAAPPQGPQQQSHAAGHTHGMTRGDEVREVSDRRLLATIGLNQILTLIQVIVGLVSGSVSLLADAAHNFSDANSLLIAYVARRFSRKAANDRYTFGYRRAELIGAAINLTLLGVLGIYLIGEAISRFWSPQEVVGSWMALAGVAALVVDVATLLLLWSSKHGSLNLRAAFVHHVVDALGSLAVLVIALAIAWRGWDWLDPVLTLALAGYVLYQVAKLLPQVVRILMEGAPADFDWNRLRAEMESVPHVISVHHLHVWELGEDHRALEAHVVVSSASLPEIESIKQELKQRLEQVFSIPHSTLEFELEGAAACPCPPDHEAR